MMIFLILETWGHFLDGFLPLCVLADFISYSSFEYSDCFSVLNYVYGLVYFW